MTPLTADQDPLKNIPYGGPAISAPLRPGNDEQLCISEFSDTLKVIDALRKELAIWKRLAELRDDLCVCYRLRHNPSERLLSELQQIKEMLWPPIR